MALFQLSDDLVRNWSSLGVEEHIPLNETMLTFALKLSIVSLFGSNEVQDLKMVNKTVKWNICYKKENMIKPRTLNKNKLP